MTNISQIKLKPYQLSLLALACGDAYGAAYEFKSPEQIPEILPYKSLGNDIMGFAPGEVTDDTDMTVITIKHLKEFKKTIPDKLKLAYYEWAKDATDVGNQISSALFHNEYNETSQGNGALMKIIPVIVYLKDELNFDIDKTRAEVRTITNITHINEEIHIVNNMFVDKIFGIYNENNYREVLNKANETTESFGWMYNSLRIVNSVLEQNLGFLDGFKACIRFGGDTDTHCAIYGAYLGTQKDIRKELNVLDLIQAKYITEIENLSKSCHSEAKQASF